MKHYSSGFFVLFTCLFVCFVAMVAMKRRAASSADALGLYQAALALSQKEYDTAFASYQSLWGGSHKFSGFLDAWRPFARTYAVSDVTAALSNAAAGVSGGVESFYCDPMGSTGLKDYLLFGEPVAGRSYQVKLRGSLNLVLAWLGTVEAEFPLMKVDRVVLSQQPGGLLAATVSLIFPDFAIGEKVVGLSAAAAK